MQRLVDQSDGAGPITHEPALPAWQPQCPAVGPSVGIILLVEDEGYVREVTRQVIELAGFPVIDARTAGEARQACQQHGERIQVLLTDVVLPDHNGRKLAEELSGRFPHLKTIFVSGYPENVVTRAQPGAGTFYLAKPFSQESLLAMIRRALAERDPGA